MRKGDNIGRVSIFFVAESSSESSVCRAMPEIRMGG
jgi:hypothetical protein